MGSEVNYPGVYIEEVGGAVKQIPGVSTSTTGFAGWASIGPVNRAEPILSWLEFEKTFGGLDARSILGYSVYHFFENGGERAVIVRIAADNATRGAVIAPNEAAFEDALLPATGKGGLYHLDQAELVNVLCVPGETNPATILKLQKFCRDRRAFLIVDCPADATFTSIKSGPGAISGEDAMNSSIYFPWVKAADPLLPGTEREFPPCGFVAGIYARTDSTRGVWRAPAGITATLNGSTGLASNKQLDDNHTGVLNPQGINVIRTFPTYGTVAWGTRTLHGGDARASEWKYIPVRRTALFIEESIAQGTQWAVFEPNAEPLWAMIRLSVENFMYALFRQGAFQGVKPKESYFVKCDRTTMTQNDIDNGVVNIEIGFAPLKPAEFVIIRIQQMAKQTGVDIEDENKEIVMAERFTRNANRFDPYKNFKFRVNWDGAAKLAVAELDVLDSIVDQAEDADASSALFAGARGTGKTMAAEIIANTLASDLQRVDLAAVVSKYIGETEKNLRRVFEEASQAGAILFFDEADALFGKRSEVKDAHDRYANIEVSYLLDRIDEFRRPVIFATSLKDNIDPAFIRRLRYVVDFPLPE